MNDRETVNVEIDALCATTQQEAAQAAKAQDIWDTQIAPLAARMMDGHIERKHDDVFSHNCGLEMDEVVLTDAGKRATSLIAAGRFKDGGELMQKAMYENCLDQACHFIDQSINDIRPLITE